MTLPAQASVVIVGGGVAGCSIAYHLTKIGVTDVVLLERRRLTCGTTWHAAGLVGQLRATRNLTELAKYTADLYHSLEAETGQATGFKQNGSVSVAQTRRRASRSSSAARPWARPSALKSTCSRAAEIKERWPLLAVDDLVGGIFSAQGRADQPDRHHASTRQGRQDAWRADPGKYHRDADTRGAGAGGRAWRPIDGYIAADTVVLCAGMWSHGLARACGVAVPLHAAEHFYIVTEPIGGPAGKPAGAARAG